MNEYQSKTRLIATLARDVAAHEDFASYPDFKDALRRRLLALRIRYQPSEFDAAVSLVTSNARLWRTPVPVNAPPPPEARPLSKSEAQSVYDALWARYRTERVRGEDDAA